MAICLPRGLAAVQAIYGVLASGAAYVPIQFAGPPERLNAITEDVERLERLIERLYDGGATSWEDLLDTP